MNAQSAALATAPQAFADLDAKLTELAARRETWVRTPVSERVALLAEVKEKLHGVADAWAHTAARRKGIPEGSPLIGEEWLSGPYCLIAYCNQMMLTLSQVAGKHHLGSVKLRDLPNGQIAARVVPNSIWDHLLLSGVTVDVWMQADVNRSNLAQHTALAYDPTSDQFKQGKLSLVLGAGNIAAIAPLDVMHKLFAENQVVMLKMNPVNDYLIEFLEPALAPFIERGLVHIVRGDAKVGQYLCEHPLVETIHITGAGASHDAIVWGPGEEGRANKASGKRKNTREITSELGAVCPTIVVPGPWSKADIGFQAEQVATQKLHNSGFNCVACQVLVVSEKWPQKRPFIDELEQVMASSTPRPLYYPGADDRMAKFAEANPGLHSVARRGAPPVMVAPAPPAQRPACETIEVFAPAMSITELPDADPEVFLKAAIAFCNDQLYGTLGANIVIHPKTMAAIGRPRFEALIADLRYGTIAVNAWTGVGFLTAQAPWGAFPGHTLEDVQSGIGFVHNSYLFAKPQRTVVEAPFKPYPRNMASGSFTLLPKPPWFITNRRAGELGRLLTEFQYRPGFAKIPAIFVNALLG